MRTSLYNTDFRAWAIQQAEAVRRGVSFDAENVAEELLSLGKSQEQQLTNRFAVLIAHLLKWEHQPGMRSSSWRRSIAEQRKRIELLIRKNPSLKSFVLEALPDAYPIAVTFTSNDTGIVEEDFPGECPYSFEHLMMYQVE